MKFSTCLLTVAAASGAIAGPLDKRFLPGVAQVETFLTTVTVDSEVSATAAASVGDGKPPTPGRRICHGRKSSSKAPADSIPAATDSAVPTVSVDPAVLAPADPATLPPADPTPLVPTGSTTSVPTNSATPGGGASNGNPSNSGDDDSGDDGGDPFIAASLMHHNIHRANHSAVDLKWNAEIAAYAATTAATCRFAHDT